MLNYEGYITELKLKTIIKDLTGNDFLGEEIKLDKYRYKFDFGYIKANKKFLVEFDGDLHYRDCNVIRRDDIKNELAKSFGYQLIRFPYWIQLTSQTLNHFFNFDNDITQNYKHGFIDKNCFLPASFCELGIIKFKYEFDFLPDNIKLDIQNSLKEKIKILDLKYVVPSSLYDLLN